MICMVFSLVTNILFNSHTDSGLKVKKQQGSSSYVPYTPLYYNMKLTKYLGIKHRAITLVDCLCQCLLLYIR